jgi:hypothetical protein
MAGSDDPTAAPRDARGRGDAVWELPRTECVLAEPSVSLGELIPPEQQLDFARQALESFGPSEPSDVREKAVEEARKLVGAA